MNFEEWFKQEYSFNVAEECMKEAWRAALDEAVKVVKDSPYRVLTQGQIEMAIKELKE